jgi:uncharacterized phage protein gp47/JayE
MATYPLATLAPVIDSTGISAPTYNDIYQSLIAQFQVIYGSDIYIAADSQDGQWIAILAQSIFDSNQVAVSVFLSFSPNYAQGAQLSSLVKLNGLQRNVATNSTAVGTVMGQAGAVITGGVVQDADGNLWNLPSPITIPVSGEVSVTATAQNAGNLYAASGTINKIFNPQLGWQTFSNTAAANPGTAVETDAQLRIRQAISTSTPALSIREAILGSILNIHGVTRALIIDNDTGAIDVNGVPAHSMGIVVEGGSNTDIGAAIAKRKPPGAQTYGTSSVVVYDIYNLPTTINYFILATTNIYFAVTIKALTGYVATTASAIQQALTDFCNGLGVGDDVYATQSQAIAALQNLSVGKTFYITDFRLGTAASPTGTTNLTIAFNYAAKCSNSNTVITVI